MNPNTGNDGLLLNRLHRLLRPNAYVEIGVREGQSLALARRSERIVAIDPAPRVQYPLPPQTRMFALNSDEFFARHDLRAELGGRALDLAFINGPALFEAALRDFINLEKHSSPESTILIHNTCPADQSTAGRERNFGIWFGDIWKLALCLKKYRPDLQLTTVTVLPAGVTIVRRLNPASTTLPSALENITREFLPCSYDLIAKDKVRMLNGIDNDWRIIRGLFPARRLPFPWAPRLLAGWRASISQLSTTARARRNLRRNRTPKFLGVLLCYNDADILPDAIEALLENNHDLLVWDHGSDDETAQVLENYSAYCRERYFVPRTFDFYQIYQAMSEHLIRTYAAQYDWISWPDQDEILEGPARDRSYADYLLEAAESPFNWIQFRNFNYWFTTEDDPAVRSPTRRILRYCLFPDCSPRIRSWRASATNIREFNHNPLRGPKYPRDFNLRHYPMRSEQQMLRRLNRDRAGMKRRGENYHYDNMLKNRDRLYIAPHELHRDDGKSELNPQVLFQWSSIYGRLETVMGQSAVDQRDLEKRQ